jgi:hypothetical protein
VSGEDLASIQADLDAEAKEDNDLRWGSFLTWGREGKGGLVLGALSVTGYIRAPSPHMTPSRTLTRPVLPYLPLQGTLWCSLESPALRPAHQGHARQVARLPEQPRRGIGERQEVQGWKIAYVFVLCLRVVASESVVTHVAATLSSPS